MQRVNIERIFASYMHKIKVRPYHERPLIFNLKKDKDRIALHSLFKAGKILNIFNSFRQQKEELSILRRNVNQPQHHTEGSLTVSLTEGLWIYYSWRDALVHLLDRNLYEELRLSRNRNLILPSEQKRFKKIRVGIAGMSAGNPIAICLALEGGALEMKFADHDFLAVSNFNRFEASVCDLGVNKAIITARQVYEINPFVKITVYDQGITNDNAENFLLKPRIDFLIEEMDNLRLKVAIRELAKKYGIPVIMATGNEANVIIDIERFDINSKIPLLNGCLRQDIIDKIDRQDEKKMSLQNKVLLSRDFIGVRYLTSRLRRSFQLAAAASLPGIPQMAESSFLRGALLCHFMRRICLGANTPSGRYIFDTSSLTRRKKIQ